MNFINANKMEGGILGSGRKWMLDYSIPHNLTDEQQKAVDLEQLSDIVRMAQPKDVAFRNVDVTFGNTPEWDGQIHVSIEASANPGYEFLYDAAKNMNKQIKNDLKMAQIMPVLKDTMQSTKNIIQDATENAKSYRVMLSDIPLTVDIVDRKRVDLAFNIMYAMADGKADHGNPICSVNGQDIPLTTDNLKIVDSNGKSFKPDLDSEWFGTEEDNKKVKEAALDKVIAEESAAGNELDRDYEAEVQDKYSICSYDNDNCSVRFAPLVWDFDKAQEMQNCMLFGLDPSVSISVVNYFNERVIIGMSHDLDVLRDFSLINKDGDVLCEKLEHDWAKNSMPDMSAKSEYMEQDFADAVAGIPVNEQAMEQ